MKIGSHILSLVLWILSVGNFFCRAQLPTFEDSIDCGDIVMGETTSDEGEQYYLFNIDNGSIYLFADSCLSDFDTVIAIYDYDMNEIAKDTGDSQSNALCNDYQARLFYGPLLNGMYVLEISGFFGATGNYTVEMNCYTIISQTCYVCIFSSTSIIMHLLSIRYKL